jgi:hypothetical protein
MLNEQVVTSNRVFIDSADVVFSQRTRVLAGHWSNHNASSMLAWIKEKLLLLPTADHPSRSQTPCTPQPWLVASSLFQLAKTIRRKLTITNLNLIHKPASILLPKPIPLGLCFRPSALATLVVREVVDHLVRRLEALVLGGGEVGTGFEFDESHVVAFVECEVIAAHCVRY